MLVFQRVISAKPLRVPLLLDYGRIHSVLFAFVTVLVLDIPLVLYAGRK